ncbi:MAG TPA: MFS transporter, partial [Steroidobacteraceae bacterium]
RMSFFAVVVISVGAVAALLRLLPRHIAAERGSIVKEFVALRDAQVLLALLTSVLCSASLFCVFTYIAPLLTDVSGFSQAAIAPILLVFGVGLTVGSTLGGRLGDRHLVPSIFLVMMCTSLVLTAMHWSAAAHAPMVLTLFVWGMLAFSLVPLLQTLIVHHAAAAPRLASTLNQGAFNLGNAIGAWSGSYLLSERLPLADLSWASVGFTLSAIGVTALGNLFFARTATVHTSQRCDAGARAAV